MRKAAFRVQEGEAKAEVTVLDFPAAPGTQMADVGANVRRWAGQVGLASLSDDSLEEMVSEVTIDGSQASLVKLIGPEESSPRKAMLAAMLPREKDGKVWFFKMVGDASLVEGQQQQFRAFLESVQIR